MATWGICPVLCLDKSHCSVEELSNLWGTHQPTVQHMLQIYKAGLFAIISFALPFYMVFVINDNGMVSLI